MQLRNREMGRKETRAAKESVNDGATEGMCAMVAGHQWSCVGKKSPKEKRLVKASKLISKFTFCFFLPERHYGNFSAQPLHTRLNLQSFLEQMFGASLRCS